MEENETLRGSMDRGNPNSKLGLHTSSSHNKKFNRVQQIDHKKSVQQLAAGARKPGKTQASGTGSTNVRTKSTVAQKETPQVQSSNNNTITVQQNTTNSSNLHPLVKGKNTKVSVSS